MRAPFQILAIPYKYENGMPIYCVLHRSDYDQWQFIAGGGEDKESPNDAAKREIMEEGGINANNIINALPSDTLESARLDTIDNKKDAKSAHTTITIAQRLFV